MTEVPKAPRWRLVDDWRWLLDHAWSLRLMMLAFFLSAVEAALPLFTDTTNIPRPVFATMIAVISGAAFIARLFAQKRAFQK